MRKIKIKEIVCIIGLLGTLTAHSQNTVWQIGNKDKSAKEFKFYKNDYRNYINDVYLYEVGRNHSADFPYFLPGPSDAWAGGISGQAVIGFSLAEAPSPTEVAPRQELQPHGQEDARADEQHQHDRAPDKIVDLRQQLREIHPNTQRHKP